MFIQGTNQTAFELERDIPDETEQDFAHLVIAKQQFPEGLSEFQTQFVLLEFPGYSLHSLFHENLLKGTGVVQQPAFEQFNLTLEELYRIGFFQFLQFASSVFQHEFPRLLLLIGSVITIQVQIGTFLLDVPFKTVFRIIHVPSYLMNCDGIRLSASPKDQ